MSASMLRFTLSPSIVFGLSIATTACAAEAENEGIAIESAPLMAAPSEDRVLTLGETVEIEVARRSVQQTFQLQLDEDEHVELSTAPLAADRPVTTRLSLYRIEGSRRRPLVSAEDREGSRGARLESSLAAGRYRVVVRGSSHTRGARFLVTANALGAEDAEPTCLFGSQFIDLRTNSALVLSPDEWITSADQLPESNERIQLVLAVQQSSHTDVTTVEEALSRVDQHEVRRIAIEHLASGHRFVVYEYGVGDNSYGAIFEEGTARIVSAIHDGDLLDCQLLVES